MDACKSSKYELYPNQTAYQLALIVRISDNLGQNMFLTHSIQEVAAHWASKVSLFSASVCAAQIFCYPLGLRKAPFQNSAVLNDQVNLIVKFLILIILWGSEDWMRVNKLRLETDSWPDRGSVGVIKFDSAKWPYIDAGKHCTPSEGAFE